MTSPAAASAAIAGVPIFVAAMLRPRIAAITSNGISNTSCKTNDTRSAGVRASMTT
jgi:hypothetical protein